MGKSALTWMALILAGLLVALALAACGGEQAIQAEESDPEQPDDGIDIVFLHHSTGGVIWDGGVPGWFDAYNAAHGTTYRITDREYPGDGYPWDNYPYDYWNIWVRHAGDKPYKKQATLEILTRDHDVIVWKHCYPVSAVQADTGSPRVRSDVRSLENYKLQYEALRDKMHEFPDTRFIVWTGAARVQAATDEAQAMRARDFFAWVVETWDEPGDNIYVWDLVGIWMVSSCESSRPKGGSTCWTSMRPAPKTRIPTAPLQPAWHPSLVSGSWM